MLFFILQHCVYDAPVNLQASIHTHNSSLRMQLAVRAIALLTMYWNCFSIKLEIWCKHDLMTRDKWYLNFVEIQANKRRRQETIERMKTEKRTLTSAKSQRRRRFNNAHWHSLAWLGMAWHGNANNSNVSMQRNNTSNYCWKLKLFVFACLCQSIYQKPLTFLHHIYTHVCTHHTDRDRDC